MATWLKSDTFKDDIESLLIEFCCRFGCSKAKAKEYLDLAMVWNKLNLVEVGGAVKAKPDVV